MMEILFTGDGYEDVAKANVYNSAVGTLSTSDIS